MASQDLTGILLIDKPKGITSFGVLNKIKKKFKIQKIGHAGTLDPDATGLLIVLLGAATKLQRFITDEKKTYSGEIRLGILTNTNDSTGAETDRKEVPELTDELLSKVLQDFLCEHLQAPPAFSAIKKDGVRSYDLARKGVEVELEQRPVTLFDADLKIIDKETISYRVTCSKGFYVRSFARDLAAALGTVGITDSIRRETSAGVDISKAILLDTLLEGDLPPILPVTDFLTQLERLDCSSEEYSKLLLGRSDVLNDLNRRSTCAGEVLILLENSVFAGILSALNGEKRVVEFLIPGLATEHKI